MTDTGQPHRNPAPSQQAALREIVLHGPVSRNDIAARVNLTAPTVSRLTRRLLDARIVRELPEAPGAESPCAPGRRAVRLDLDPHGGFVLGLSIFPIAQMVSLANLKNRIVAATAQSVAAYDDPDRVIARLAEEGRRLVANHVGDRGRLLGGFAIVDGAVDSRSGAVAHSSDLGGWENVALGERLSELFDAPFGVENTTRARALAATRFGPAHGRDNVLALDCGKRIDSAVMAGGRLLSAGAVSHRTTGDTDLDREAGAARILGGLNSVDPGRMSAWERTDALLDAIERDTDRESSVGALMTEAGRALGRAAAAWTRLVESEIVVLSGPLALSPSYVEGVRSAIAEENDAPGLEVAASAFAGTIAGGRSTSCSLAICEHLFERPLDIDRFLPSPPPPAPGGGERRLDPRRRVGSDPAESGTEGRIP